MGFASESRERSRPVLPLAGMVDVLFLLLVFFLSTYSMREQEMEIDVDMSTSRYAEPSTNQATRVIITYFEDGRVMLGSREVRLEMLQGELAKLAQITTEQPVILRGDQAAQVGLQAKIMDAALAVGLTDIRLGRLGEEQE